jgi:radical SAM protein with 4Fe4S-binding SPASM domain
MPKTSIIANSFLPASAVLEMTYSCNNKCLFCSCPWEYSDSGYVKNKELTLDEWKSCISKLIDLGICNISYTGGEPFLNKNILEIIEFTSRQKAKHVNKSLDIIENPPNQFLISNGQLLDEKFLVFLKKHNVHLSLSLPGLTTYNYHTQNGNYKKILQLFKLAKEIGIQTTANITVTKKNIGELYETISNALIAGADLLLLNRFLPGGRGMTYADELLLDKNDVIEMLQIADDVLVKANRKGSTGTEIPICLLKGLQLKNLKVGTRCSAAIDFFVVGPEGMVRTCNHSSKMLEHFTNIESLKNNEYWKIFTQKNYLPAMCKNCNYTYCCDGGCREAAHMFSGSLNACDPIFSNENMI